jgi:predicted O-linked N-acetylglucosamine transferase (SPINDLY family)
MDIQIQLMLQQAIRALQGSNFNEANSILNEVLQKDINSADTIFELGIAYANANRFTEALSIFCCLQPYKMSDARIPYNSGLIYSLQSKHQLALESYDLALKIQPNDVETLINKSSTCNDIKNYVLALESLEYAIQIRADIPEAWSNKGIALNNLNLYQESIAAYNEALKLNPNYHEAWSNKSVPLSKLKRFLEASKACDKALSLKPDYAEAYYNKGNALNELKHFDEAIVHYDKALCLQPDYAEAWNNKGVALDAAKHFSEAIAHYDKALSLKPDYAEAWNNKGVALDAAKHFSEAIAHYERALSLQSDLEWIYGDLIHAKMKICSWSDLLEYSENIARKVLANEQITSPFPMLSLIDDSLLHKRSSEIYTRTKYPFNPALGPLLKRPKSQQIRIGYFSADFHNHATGYLMAELFELHDKSQFELIGFSFGPIKNDEMRQRLEKSFDYFIEVGNKSDIETAQLSRSLNIDIAVDLKGFTKDLRAGIFAHRAAPIQVNYLGYPGTMGADYIEYIIADKTLIPLDAQSCYSEKVVYLPNSYQVNDRGRLISERQFTRLELGLPEDRFVFCCFNNNYKILPATFDGWMRILKAVEGSVLWLLQDNLWAVENLKKEAQKQGIDAKRLVFADRMPLSEHLARHCQANLFLDTFPYNAHTTASDALWTGLPVLTLMGQSFASRVAASLLNAMGSPELVTNTREEYEALAIELAMNPKKLADIKLKLTNNRLTTPLFDTPLFARHLESAYIKMYEQYLKGFPPECIDIQSASHK